LFLLDERRRPRFVAGVPPDYFSADGQLWGNPLFDWEALRRTGHRWCIDRMRALLAHVDAIRLDHFRAFAAAWHIPAGSPTAQAGDWRPGPGADFFLAVQRELGSLPFIVEDLGYITPDVNALRDQFQFPGTRVLQFAFDGGSDNPHLPQNYTPNTVVYTGTHDNPPTKGWYDELPAEQRENVWRSLGSSPSEGREIAWELIRLAWSSVAALAIAPLQDVFNLDLDARMNIPGRADGNWAWRATTEMMSETAFHRLSDMTTSSNRRAMVPRPITREMLSVAP
jgi:4-alpha-glucanotransferase